jgi:hypothetical protein
MANICDEISLGLKALELEEELELLELALFVLETRGVPDNGKALLLGDAD